ncbi:glycine--tRNA ligase [Candidatus Parcubacteria bacterium]|nr:glycine--tRNA ligase [Candidatus Parcubacteria bacterium]
MAEKSENLMEKVVSLCKRRGFVYPSSEIYGGFAGFWNYGHYGAILKENIKCLWKQRFIFDREDMFVTDTTIISNPKVLEASGHVKNFGNEIFKVEIGTGEETTTSHLRAETAQGIFTDFKNVVDTHHPKLPFGIGQVGKAFRNEISPRDFIFRSREFEQMEVEYFVKENDWEKYFQEWVEKMRAFGKEIGLVQTIELQVAPEDRAHYSKRTVDFQFDYPFGRGELWGLAYRTDFDLKNHGLEYFDEESGDRLVPHVIEPSLGVDRTFLAILLSAYTEDDLGGERRAYLKLPKNIAPVRAAVFPLLKNKPELVAKAREVYAMLKKEIPNIEFDDNGNIGKRYRRQDEIGTPSCITIDFDTLGETPDLKDTVTLRDRDSGEQERVRIEDLKEKLR